MSVFGLFAVYFASCLLIKRMDPQVEGKNYKNEGEKNLEGFSDRFLFTHRRIICGQSVK